MKNTFKILFVIFILALFIRFAYFPENIYFGFDQARDAYESLNIYKNFDLKIIGPSTASEGLFHGPLYWYLIGPLYLLGSGNPAYPAAFLLFLNALGVFGVFYLGKILFNEKAAIFAALLYAASFEQTQYAMYFGNPGPAVLTTLIFYLGLALAVFKRDWRGIPVSLVGLGLSVQFEFFLIYLAVIFVLLTFSFKKRLKKLVNPNKVFISILFLVLTLSSFIISELKFGFRTTKVLFATLSVAGTQETPPRLVARSYFERLSVHIHDNVLAFGVDAEMVILVILLLASGYIVIKRKEEYEKVIFLLAWILSSSILYLFGVPNLYYINVGISAAVLLLVSYFTYKIYQKSYIASAVLIVAIFASNLFLVARQNPKGVINDIYVQEGMLLWREKRVIDYIYSESGGKPIVVSASTMPLNINTTWAFLFNWYGTKTYGYLPYWAGQVAQGFPGELPEWKSQEEDYAFFSIIEPVRGVRQAFIDKFLEEQKQYGQIVEEKIYGDLWYNQLVVQKRI